MIFKRELSDVSWAASPLLKERIDVALADDIVDDASVVSQQNLALDIIYKFVCGINNRLNENQDMEFLEACTLFDARPKFKAKNFRNRNEYLKVVLTRFKVENESVRGQVYTGLTLWATSEEAYDETKLALRVLKFLPATALVESRFSLTSSMKSKGRALLDIKKLRGMLLMKDEPPFKSTEVSFVQLWHDMKPWLNKHGLIKVCRRRLTPYSVRKVREGLLASHSHAVSDRYV